MAGWYPPPIMDGNSPDIAFACTDSTVIQPGKGLSKHLASHPGLIGGLSGNLSSKNSMLQQSSVKCFSIWFLDPNHKPEMALAITPFQKPSVGWDHSPRPVSKQYTWAQSSHPAFHHNRLYLHIQFFQPYQIWSSVEKFALLWCLLVGL